MRRFSFIPVLTVLLVAGSGTPARAQLAQELLGGQEQLLGLGPSVTGRLVDFACLTAVDPAALTAVLDQTALLQQEAIAVGELATDIGKDKEPKPDKEAELVRCQEKSAMKGQRFAVQAVEGMYLIRGPLTEKNNEVLRPWLNQMVRVSGKITQQDMALLNTVVEPPGDTRRNPRRDGETIIDRTRRGDFREGDPRSGVVSYIDATNVLAVDAR